MFSWCGIARMMGMDGTLCDWGQRYASATATSASLERCFSTVGMIYGQYRNRLQSIHVQFVVGGAFGTVLFSIRQAGRAVERARKLAFVHGMVRVVAEDSDADSDGDDS